MATDDGVKVNLPPFATIVMAILTVIVSSMGYALSGFLQDYHKLQDEVTEIRLDTAKNYITKDDFREVIESLHKIEDKLDKKADK